MLPPFLDRGCVCSLELPSPTGPPPAVCSQQGSRRPGVCTWTVGILVSSHTPGDTWVPDTVVLVPVRTRELPLQSEPVTAGGTEMPVLVCGTDAQAEAWVCGSSHCRVAGWKLPLGTEIPQQTPDGGQERPGLARPLGDGEGAPLPLLLAPGVCISAVAETAPAFLVGWC